MAEIEKNFKNGLVGLIDGLEQGCPYSIGSLCFTGCLT